MIDYSLDAANSLSPESVLVAIPYGDKKLIDYCKYKKIKYFEGSEVDVLDRFYQCAKHTKPDIIIRLCADTVYEKNDIKEILELYKKRKRFTYGNGVFIFSWDELSLARSYAEGTHREHVTTWLYRSIDLPGDINKVENLL